ncbi:MAG: hypothetical protein PVH61_39260 [Candidatus Aminicenantes bacterium]|jgi:hypothetical protein
MKCKDFQKLLYLNREGERTSSQEKKLARHLRRCQVCANEKLKIEKINKLTTMARETIPHHSKPQELTNSIMNSIDQLTRTAEIPPSTAKGTLWFDWLWLPKVRFALVCAVLLIMGVFIYQGTVILHRISGLEKKMALQSEKLSPSSPSFIVSKKLLRTGIRRALENADQVYDMYQNLPDDKVIIDKNTLRLLLKLLKDRLRDDEILLKLRENDSLFNEIDFTNGIKKEELKKILEKKIKVLQKI